MKIIIYGASGMVGKGILYECLNTPDVEQIIVVVRKSLQIQHQKLQEIVTNDLANDPTLDKIHDIDGCFYCLGVSSAGMSEAEYTALTYDLTINVARKLLNQNPSLTFTYVSGGGTDNTEQGKTMWARVKGKTENHLQQMPFKGAYSFRPMMILAPKGIESKTTSYRWMYKVFYPFFPLVKKLAPNSISTTSDIAKAMLNCVRNGYKKNILEVEDINQLAKK